MLLLPRARCLKLLANSLLSLQEVKQIHGQMIISAALQQGSAAGLLIDRYFESSTKEGPKFASLAFRYHARELDLFAWNVMIRRSSPFKALLLYADLDTSGDGRTTLYALGACARSGRLKEGMQIHARIVKTRFPDELEVAIRTTGVYFYGILGELKSARHLFEEMLFRKQASWNALLTGFCLWGKVAEVVFLFKEFVLVKEFARATARTMVLMLCASSQIGVLELGCSVHGYSLKIVSFEEDVFLCTGLVDMYAKCGCLESAKKAFEDTREAKNVLTWTAMAAALAIHGQGDKASQLLEAMVSSGVSPNGYTFTCLLSAFCHGGFVKEGLSLFERMASLYGVTPGIEHYGCVVDLLARAGMEEEALRIVEAMPMKPDAVLWRILFSACKIHGKFALGFKIAGKLEMEEPEEQDCDDDYVALSNLYASAGMWEDVWGLREKMKLDGVRSKPGLSLAGTSRGSW